jgi:Zn-finger nucleic acid-binding protein
MKTAQYRPMNPVCPKCDVALLNAQDGDVAVDYCDQCRGVWLDAGELEALGGRLPAILRTTTQHQHLCPRCDRPLNEIEFTGNLTLDQCPAGHGLWFDADELPTLLAATNAGPLADFLQPHTTT